MKKLVLIISLLFLTFQAQAGYHCKVLETPCDDRGNRYFCFHVSRDTDYRPPLCGPIPQHLRDDASEATVTQRRSDPYDNMDTPQQSHPYDFMKECVKKCMAETGGSRNWCAASYCW